MATPGGPQEVDLIAKGCHPHFKLPTVFERAELVELEGVRWLSQAP